MINTFSAVKAICICSDWSVSNLSIQKLLYISHMIYMGKKSKDKDALEPLINNQFYAWAYGPVVREVYKELRMFGADDVSNFYRLENSPGLDEELEEYKTIKDVCEQLKGVRSARLVAYTHDEIGAWSHLYDMDKPDTVISNEDIYDEYCRRCERASE